MRAGTSEEWSCKCELVAPLKIIAISTIDRTVCVGRKHQTGLESPSHADTLPSITYQLLRGKGGPVFNQPIAHIQPA